MLDRLYTKLDNLVDKYELFKVETIGGECLQPALDRAYQLTRL